jgi:hypothetical protein
VADVAKRGFESLSRVIELVLELSNLETFIVRPLFKQLVEAGLELHIVQRDSLLALGEVYRAEGAALTLLLRNLITRVLISLVFIGSLDLINVRLHLLLQIDIDLLDGDLLAAEEPAACCLSDLVVLWHAVEFVIYKRPKSELPGVRILSNHALSCTTFSSHRCFLVDVDLQTDPLSLKVSEEHQALSLLLLFSCCHALRNVFHRQFEPDLA